MASTSLPASIANLTQPTRYVSTTETAKMIRQALKEAFPEVKFSVRSDKYAGGSSIRVGWVDGPRSCQVEAVAKAFQGGDFDGMQDLKTCRTHTIDGQPVRFSADFVFCNRELSDGARASVLAALEALSVEGRASLLIRLGLTSYHYDAAHPVKDLVHPVAHAIPAPRFEGRRSKTADAVNNITG